MPAASEPRTVAETALWSSVRSVTRAVRLPTLLTVPTSPRAVTTGSSTRIPSLAPGGDHDRLRVRTGRPVDHLGGNAVEALREARARLEPEEGAEASVLLLREPGTRVLLPEGLVLALEPLGVGARVDEALGPAVGVAKRGGDPVGGDLERPERRRGRGLRAGHGTVLVLPERERDEHEREQHEAPHDEPPPEGCGGS